MSKRQKLNYLLLLLPSRSMRPSAIISASLIVHCNSSFIRNCNVAVCHSMQRKIRLAILPAKYIVKRRNKSTELTAKGMDGTAGANIIRSQLKSSIIDLFRRRLTALTGLTAILRPDCKKTSLHEA